MFRYRTFTLPEEPFDAGPVVRSGWARRRGSTASQSRSSGRIARARQRSRRMHTFEGGDRPDRPHRVRAAVGDDHGDLNPGRCPDGLPDPGGARPRVGGEKEHASRRGVGCVHAGVGQKRAVSPTEEEPRHAADDGIALLQDDLDHPRVHRVPAGEVAGCRGGFDAVEPDDPAFCSGHRRLGDDDAVSDAHATRPGSCRNEPVGDRIPRLDKAGCEAGSGEPPTQAAHHIEQTASR
jgi:hypothetical protein